MRKGYVVVRVEKPSEGDSFGTTKCLDCDLKTEVDAFLKGLEKTKTFSYVDTTNIFLWGHSLGGIIAPMMANKMKVKGVVGFGTALSSWYEYVLDLQRLQPVLLGDNNYSEIEENVKTSISFFYDYLILKKTPAELEKNEVYKKFMT